MAAALQIPTNPLGAAGQRVPRVALGCGNFGGVGSAPEFFGQGLTHSEAFELMDAAWELGIRHFDTADAYGGGRSERAIGAWIRSRRAGPRSRPRPSTRWTPDADQGLAPDARPRGNSRRASSASGSSASTSTSPTTSTAAVPLTTRSPSSSELREAGQVVAYGVSNFDALQLAAGAGHRHTSAIQNGTRCWPARRRGGRACRCASAAAPATSCSARCAGGWLTGKYRRGEAYPFGSRMTQRPEPYAASRHRRDLRPPRVARAAVRPTRDLDGRARRWPGCWPTSGSPRSSSGPAAPSTSSRSARRSSDRSPATSAGRSTETFS